MADSAQPQASGAQTTSGGLVISPEIQEKFSPLLELIKASESMNNEERQYWINILPVMTPEQIKNLEDILQNEKKQLAAIDEKYSNQAEESKRLDNSKVLGEKIKTQKRKREEIEQEETKKEEIAEEDILGKIQAM